eukprot:scaffold44889_cov83-Phaeocystis_antarctica.AAC.2
MRIKRSGKTFLATMVVAVAAATPPRSIPFCAVVATNGQVNCRPCSPVAVPGQSKCRTSQPQ